MRGSDIQVTVPEGTEPELMAFVASLWSRGAATHNAGTPPANGGPASTAANSTPVSIRGPLSVQQIYEGGTSQRWRPFLEYFAHRPDQWVKMAEGVEHVGFSVQQGVGLVGAAERRCGGSLPYQKRWGTDGKAEVRMSTEVAQEILELASAATAS